MKELIWSREKDELLKNTRGVSFENLVNARLIGIEKHHTRHHQWLMLFEFRNYVWVVPYVESKEHYFLKTAFPSRKHTQKYLKRSIG